MSDNNIIRRIANNHQIKFAIEPMSCDLIGGVKITLVKENEDGSESCISKNIPRYDIDALLEPNMRFMITLINMLDEAEKEDE